MSYKSLMRGTEALVLLGLAVALLLPQSSRGQSTAGSGYSPGALVRVDMHTAVGVELDEIPAGPQREAAATWALSQDKDFWVKRAREQVNLTYYRLVFRQFFYTAPPARGDLPLPPHTAWRLEFTDEPRRLQIGTHDYVAIPYHFQTYIVTDSASPGTSEPALSTVG